MKIKRGTYLPDCHVHTAFSTDSGADPDEVIRKAEELGMPMICITDHHDIGFPGGEFQLDIPVYRQAIKNHKERYADRIEVLCGIEMGLQAYLAEGNVIETLLSGYDFDYVIGSVHLVDGKDVYVRRDFDMSDAELYRLYFEQVLECVTNIGGYHALGHLDYVVRYGYERDREYSYERFSDVLDAILEKLIEKEIALEVNTAGYRKGLGFTNPHPDILWRYRDLGGERITLGSDAHSPGDLGADFRKTAEMLQAFGYRFVSVFHGKEEAFLPLG